MSCWLSTKICRIVQVCTRRGQAVVFGFVEDPTFKYVDAQYKETTMKSRLSPP